MRRCGVKEEKGFVTNSIARSHRKARIVMVIVIVIVIHCIIRHVYTKGVPIAGSKMIVPNKFALGKKVIVC